MKKTITTIILLSIFIANFMVACNQSQWGILQETGYEITYPKDWELVQPGPMGTEFMLFSPLTGSNDKFKENINFIIQVLSNLNLDLDKYTEISENQIKTLMTNSNIIESTEVPGKKHTYHKIIYTAKQGIFDLKFMQYYWIIDDKAYLLTFTAEQKEFDKYLPTAQKIMDSFKLSE